MRAATAVGTLNREMYGFKNDFLEGQIGVFRQNKSFQVMQHGNSQANHRGSLAKVIQVEKMRHPSAPLHFTSQKRLYAMS